MGQMTYHKQTAHFLATVAQCMPEMSIEIMQKWIKDPKALITRLELALCPSPRLSDEFEIWKTINATPINCINEVLIQKGYQIDEYTKEILNSILPKSSLPEILLDLVVVSASQLGITSCDVGIKILDLYKRASEFGLELCPFYVGPELRLQYPDQPIEEKLMIGMDYIHHNGSSCLFAVENSNGDKVFTSYKDIEGCDENIHWVFVLPRIK